MKAEDPISLLAAESGGSSTPAPEAWYYFLGAPFWTWPWWLVGAYSSIAAEFFWVLGLALLKRSYRGGAWQVKSPGLWVGAVCILVAPGLRLAALLCAPCSTVTAAAWSQVLFTYVFGLCILGERFKKTDTRVYLLILAGGAIALYVVSRSETVEVDMSTWFPDPSHVRDWLHGLLNNYGFLAYTSSWAVTLMILLRLYLYPNLPSSWAMGSTRHSWSINTLPMITGVIGGGSKVMTILTASLVYNYQKPHDWHTAVPWVVSGIAFLMELLTFFFTIRGIQQFNLRYFLPSSLAVSQVLTVVQGVIFFREWQEMTGALLFWFMLSSVVSIVAVATLRHEHDTTTTPFVRPQQAVMDDDDALEVPANYLQLLAVLREHGVPERIAVEAPADSPLAMPSQNIMLSSLDPVTGCPAVLLRLVPATLMFGTPAGIGLLIYYGWDRIAFSVLAVYFVIAAWRYSVHISIFSNVGRAKCAIFEEGEWKAMYMRQLRSASKEAGDQTWRKVRHFVIVANYKEAIEIMRETIDSIKASSVAREQIVLVLAMEAREEGSEEKAALLTKMYESDFLDIIATFHPAGLEGETPGKAANERWAAQKLFERFGMQMHNVITIADADSIFHNKYFDAVTYHYLASREGRYRTIWQPPVINYRNYHSQPALVRLASLLMSQHELARLADHHAWRLPLSTYSISMKLAMDVGGWDPDWISEDWHMCAKCSLASGGMLVVQPIFLPVINYAPEGENWFETIWARWTQAKRHALGIGELVYVLSMLPSVFRHRPHDRCGTFRRLAHLWLQMLAIHIFMGTLIINGPINTFVAGLVVSKRLMSGEFPFPIVFATNIAVSFVMSASLTGWCATNVYLYRSLQSRIIPPAESSWWPWDNTFLHWGRLWVESFVVSPIFFFMGAAAEWIAAVRTMFTHTFQYDVALKAPVPKGAEDEEAPNERTPLVRPQV